VAEWSKAHAWKVCIRQRIEGSNPFLSAERIYNSQTIKPINILFMGFIVSYKHQMKAL
jgi:hypothetical protein